MEPQKYCDSKDKSPELWISRKLNLKRNKFCNNKLRGKKIVLISVVDVKD
jgi:hypothetical protein